MISAKVTYKDMTPQLLKDLQVKQLSFVTQGGERIKTEQATRAIPDTGNLRASVETQAFVEDGKAVSETGATAGHSLYVEYGTGVYAEPEGGGTRAKKIPWTYFDEQTGKFITTRGMKAQPFAEPGFQAARPSIDNLANKVLRA